MPADTLDYKQEAKNIKDALRESGMQITYYRKVATTANFEETIRKQPKVLHISCHGVYKKNEKGMGVRN